MAIDEDTILDLNFVPAWARKPPEGSKFTTFEEKGGRREKRREGGFSRDGFGKRPGRKPSSGGPPRRHGAPPASRAPHVQERDFSHQDSHPGITVSFIPERRGLKPLAAKLAKTRRAFSLMDVAFMFISKPEFYAVKMESDSAGSDEDRACMFQCKECKLLFLEKSELERHAFNKHADLHYAIEESEGEEPKGNFVCVARCGLSGELLGPPNYHAFNDRVVEMHAARFSRMTIEEYRNRIVNDNSPELLEKWKQEARKQTVYRTTSEEEPLTFTRRMDAEHHFIENHASKFLREGKRFIIPGVAAEKLEDSRLRRIYRGALQHESRFPLKMSIAIRPAFRHLGLYTFKAGEKSVFVTSVQPNAMEISDAAPEIRELIECLLENPGSNRAELVEKLRPDNSPDSPEASEILRPLRWLIEKGHVIEFHDGRMSVPRRQGKTSRTEKTSEKPVKEDSTEN